MLTFVGLGLWNERSITIAGREAIRAADRCFAEFYTSYLGGTTLEALESFHETTIEVCDREAVEQHPDPILGVAADGDAVFLTAGDPMISTTHVDLRLRAIDRDIETQIIHGPTAQTAASSLTGLQNYRFGKATTMPFPRAHGGDVVPESVISTIEANRKRGLHTIVYLDIKASAEEYMAGDTAAELLTEAWHEERLGIVIGRAGSPNPIVEGATLSTLATRDFGDPLHLLVVPGDLHLIEIEALRELAGVPPELLSEK